MATSVIKGGTHNSPQNLRLSKPNDMTIQWKALEEYFLMQPLVFLFKRLPWKNSFSTFWDLKVLAKQLKNSKTVPLCNILHSVQLGTLMSIPWRAYHPTICSPLNLSQAAIFRSSDTSRWIAYKPGIARITLLKMTGSRYLVYPRDSIWTIAAWQVA
jgi:hypothetical protein